MAYVLLPGEKDAPVGLRNAMKNTNILQETLMTYSRPGKLAGEIYNEIMAEMSRRGIEASSTAIPLASRATDSAPASTTAPLNRVPPRASGSATALTSPLS